MFITQIFVQYRVGIGINTFATQKRQMKSFILQKSHEARLFLQVKIINIVPRLHKIRYKFKAHELPDYQQFPETQTRMERFLQNLSSSVCTTTPVHPEDYPRFYV